MAETGKYLVHSSDDLGEDVKYKIYECNDINDFIYQDSAVHKLIIGAYEGYIALDTLLGGGSGPSRRDIRIYDPESVILMPATSLNTKKVYINREAPSGVTIESSTDVGGRVTNQASVIPGMNGPYYVSIETRESTSEGCDFDIYTDETDKPYFQFNNPISVENTVIDSILGIPPTLDFTVPAVTTELDDASCMIHPYFTSLSAGSQTLDGFVPLSMYFLDSSFPYTQIDSSTLQIEFDGGSISSSEYSSITSSQSVTLPLIIEASGYIGGRNYLASGEVYYNLTYTPTKDSTGTYYESVDVSINGPYTDETFNTLVEKVIFNEDETVTIKKKVKYLPERAMVYAVGGGAITLNLIDFQDTGFSNQNVGLTVDIDGEETDYNIQNDGARVSLIDCVYTEGTYDTSDGCYKMIYVADDSSVELVTNGQFSFGTSYTQGTNYTQGSIMVDTGGLLYLTFLASTVISASGSSNSDPYTYEELYNTGFYEKEDEGRWNVQAGPPSCPIMIGAGGECYISVHEGCTVALPNFTNPRVSEMYWDSRMNDNVPTIIKFGEGTLNLTDTNPPFEGLIIVKQGTLNVGSGYDSCMSFKVEEGATLRFISESDSLAFCPTTETWARGLPRIECNGTLDLTMITGKVTIGNPNMTKEEGEAYGHGYSLVLGSTGVLNANTVWVYSSWVDFSEDSESNIDNLTIIDD